MGALTCVCKKRGRRNGIELKRTHSNAFVCLPCRKVFKKLTYIRSGVKYERVDFVRVCPQCGQVLREVGDTFRAPKKDDEADWNKVARTLAKGRRFVRDEAYLSQAGRSKARKTQKRPKGVRSLFQVPARKRKRAAR
jgi:hypothetical protein